MSQDYVFKGLSFLLLHRHPTALFSTTASERSPCGYGEKGQWPPLFSPQAEKVFMVARGLVREAQEDLQRQQAKLKEVRDRLDRISREDSQYLELATLEHRMLQVGALAGSPPSPGQGP